MFGVVGTFVWSASCNNWLNHMSKAQETRWQNNWDFVQLYLNDFDNFKLSHKKVRKVNLNMRFLTFFLSIWRRRNDRLPSYALLCDIYFRLLHPISMTLQNLRHYYRMLLDSLSLWTPLKVPQRLLSTRDVVQGLVLSSYFFPSTISTILKVVKVIAKDPL